MDTEIVWPPSNVTVPLGRHDPAVFSCNGRGTTLLWWINDDLVEGDNQRLYENRGFMFMTIDPYNGTLTSTVSLPATAENNNTNLRCRATDNQGTVASEPVTLTIAGSYFTDNSD